MSMMPIAGTTMRIAATITDRTTATTIMTTKMAAAVADIIDPGLARTLSGAARPCFRQLIRVETKPLNPILSLATP